VEYPESDGQPMRESDATRNYWVYCVEALRLFFQSRPQVYVSGNLFIYYQEGHPEKSLSPDVFVIFGVSKREGTGSVAWESYKHCLQRVRLHIASLVIATKICQSPKFLALQQEQL
jgi:hypothetical protein